MSVAVLRMLTGEEIVGEIDDSKEGDAVFVKNPHVLRFRAGQQEGQIGIEMGPLAPFAQTDKDDDFVVPINPTLVVFSYTPDAQIIDSYKQVVTQQKSSLILPEKSGSIVTP